MGNITIIGSINMDLVTKATHMPKPGETVFGVSFETICGGKGANQAVACARLGAKTSMIGKIGNDDFGKMMLSNLQQANVDCCGVATSNVSKTGLAIITVDKQGENSIIVVSGANMELSPNDIDKNRSSISLANVAIAQLEVPLDCIKHAFRIAKLNGVTTLLNPAPAKPLDQELISLVDILVPNETELEILSGEKITDDASIKKAAKKLLAMGVKNVIVTLGKNGSIAFDQNGEIIRQNSYNVQAVDTTAAGDCFIGGFSSAISDKKSIKEAMEYASKASAISVTVFGAQNSIPTKKTVENFVF